MGPDYGAESAAVILWLALALFAQGTRHGELALKSRDPGLNVVIIQVIIGAWSDRVWLWGGRIAKLPRPITSA